MIIDYQNIHLTAHECFAAHGTAPHESLVHPLHFANQILHARQDRLSDLARGRGEEPPEPVRLAGVSVFRGIPSNRRNSDGYRRNLAQAAEWTRDRRVDVNHRPLTYHIDRQGNLLRIEEKGIDVMIAIKLVRSADRGLHDVVVLASHDTDLEPAIDAALEGGRAKIETAGWRNRKRLKPTGSPGLWHTFLRDEHFERSRDRKDYT